ncbi:MAG: DUF4339 domain-containing protein [Treponema sp.]|nr:DUF4339 domain-containing protein [Treponema sp.]
MAKFFQPTVVIGVGGTGKNTLLSLKKMIIENSPNGMKDFPLLKLFSLDTDIRIDSVSSEIKTIKDDIKLDPNTEMFSLGGEGITSTLELDAFPEIKSWFPYSKRHQLNPNMLSGGASQMKPVGRFSFAWNAQSVRTKLEQILGEAVTTDVARSYGIGENNCGNFTNVFICGSICGGTGSGTFLDLAYLVRFVAAKLGIVVKIYSMLALASIYDGIQGDLKLKQNCYASLVELDHFMNIDNFSSPYRQFYPAYRNVNSDTWDYSKTALQAFDYPYIFDKTNEAGLSFGSPKEFADMVARFIYLLTGSEAADKWQSMNNNVDPIVCKNDNNLNKPIWYRGMGAFALLYPRRKITQICAFKFASEYFNVILDSSYQNAEIEPIVTRFFNDSKSNPDTELLKENFNLYKESSEDSVTDTFTNFIENQVGNAADNFEELDKTELVKKVREFKEDMEKDFAKFKIQNAIRARDLVKKFLSDFDERIADFVDLKLAEDTENKPADGSKKMVRGSLVRAYDFTKLVFAKFTEASEKFRKEIESTKEIIKDKESEFDEKIQELDAAVDSFIGGKKKQQEAYEDALETCKDLMEAKTANIIATWIRQFFNEVTENNIHIADGVLKELESRSLVLNNSVNKLKKLKEEVDDYIYKNKGGKSDNFCEIIFNYKTDVEGMYNKLMAEDGLDREFENLSKKLKDDSVFGKSYQRLGTLPEVSILTMLLRKAEEPFFEPVSKVDIGERLLEEPEKLANLTSGTYIANSKVYLKLNGQEMSKAGLDTNGKVFFAITIPNESEYVRYCKDLTSVSQGKQFACPFDEGGANSNDDERCPRYGKCLKAKILTGAKSDLTLIPSENKSEINILKTVAGFPLRAVTTVSGPYKEEYKKAVKDQQLENEKQGLKEEVLHMFGPLRLFDLDEAADSPTILEANFRKELLLALALRRLSIEKLSVKFLTQEDIKFDRDTPSYELGNSFEEVLHLAQSTRFDDMEKVAIVSAGVKYDIESFNTSELKDVLFERLKTCYDESRKKLPFGMTDKDIDVLDELSVEYCGGRHVKEEKIAKSAAERFAKTASNTATPATAANVPPVPGEKKYHVALDGKDAGEFGVSELKQMFSAGKFNRQTLVWAEGFSGWAMAETVPELSGIFTAPPPVPGSVPPVPPIL